MTSNKLHRFSISAILISLLAVQALQCITGVRKSTVGAGVFPSQLLDTADLHGAPGLANVPSAIVVTHPAPLAGAVAQRSGWTGPAVGAAASDLDKRHGLCSSLIVRSLVLPVISLRGRNPD